MLRMFLQGGIVATIAILAPALASGDERLICCGASEVFLLPAGKEAPTVEDRLWRWTAADSPEIPVSLHARFRSTDECKPYGPYMLITSSSDGVALVRREDKACVFFTLARNAHSACLLPGERIAVAASFGGDELRVYHRNSPGAEAKPVCRWPLEGAHGAWWDIEAERLWALGERELLKLRLQGSGSDSSLSLEAQWRLPTTGGHDLSPARDSKSLLITTNTHVYRFERTTGVFTPYEPLAESKRVKSVDEHPRLDRTVYHQAAGPNWWSDRIRFTSSERTIHLPGERLYKVRWDVDRGLPP